MSYLYETLRSASRPERQEITTWLFQEMRDGPNANDAFYELCCDVIEDVTHAPPELIYNMGEDKFSAEASASIARIVPRVMGYLQAIDRVPLIETAIDGGCGSSALLSLAITSLRPEASKVTAYEIDEEAAQCAQAMADLCGMDKRIEVRHENILQAVLPTDVDLGVTETFDAGLLYEPGHKITAALARCCREVLPAKAKLWAVDDDRAMNIAYRGTGSEYQYVGTIDLTQENHEFQGSFESIGTGERFPVILAGYYDARDEPVIRPGAASDITRPAVLGPTVAVHELGSRINFRYILGSNPSNTHEAPQTWID